MKSAIIAVLLLVSFAAATENTQLVQTNVNVQNVESEKPFSEPESVTSQIAVQEVLSVNQDVSAPPSQPPPPSPPQNNPQSVPDPQNVQLLKEANAQYQYQINSRYEEKTRPIYGDAANPAYNQPYPYFPMMYPYYKENSQYQELGNGQRRAETNVVVNDGVRAQYENQDQSSYSHQRSQSYSEYGKGEASPEYNTYSYKRTYY